MKKIISLTLTIALVFSLFLMPVAAVDTQSNGTGVQSSSINSFGGLVGDKISAEMKKQLENNGFNVFSLEYQNGIVSAELEALSDCTLLVGIYSEDGETLHTSNTTEVKKDDWILEVAFDVSLIPEYFLITAYLVNSYDFKPLCTAYTTPNYTKEMQDFFSKKASDFDEDEVLQLETDDSNNFAVYNSAVIRVDEISEIVITEQDGVYNITNASQEIINLKQNDIFSYNYDNGDTLILKVGAISVSGSTVTITEAELELEDVFDYVKIDTSKNGAVAQVDDTALPEGITYYGAAEPISVYGTEVEDSATVEYSYELNKYEFGNGDDTDTSQSNATISGSIGLKLTAGVKLYITATKLSLELRFDYNVNFGVEVAGKAAGYIPLGKYVFSPVAGVYIELNPSVAAEFSGAIGLEAALDGTVGFKVGVDGVKNLTKTPKISAGVQIETSVFLGLSLEPKIKIISEKVAATSLTVTAGGEIDAKLEYGAATGESKTKRHTCESCIKGEYYGKINLKFQIKLLNLDFLTFEHNTVNLKLKLTDFYYSVDNNEFGLGSCKYIGYRTTVSVKNKNGKAMKTATVTVDGERQNVNSKGITTLYLVNGEHKITAKAIGYTSTTKKVKIKNGTSSVAFKLEKSSFTGKFNEGKFDINRNAGLIDDDGTLYTFGNSQWGILGDGVDRFSEDVPPQAILDDVKSIQIENLDNAAITKNDDLYMWGMNHTGGCGKGEMLVNKPNKVMSNVKTVSFYEYDTAIVTKDGGLYTLGSGYNGMLGDGFTGDRSTPVKILDNVAVAKVHDSHKAAAIKENGDFYMWGLLREELGTTISTPTKFLENAADIVFGDSQTFVITKNGDLYSVGQYCGRYWSSGFDKVMGNVASVYTKRNSTYVITKDKELYAFGYNYYGTLGNGTTVDQTTPVKIMDDVEYVSLGYLSAYAIKSNGDLYSWGDNSYSQLGNGNNTAQNKPQKIMSNVVFVDNGTNVTAAIIEDGSIYVWGEYIKPFLSQNITKSNYPIKVDYFDTTTYSLCRSTGDSYTDLMPNSIYNYYVINTDVITNTLCDRNLEFAGQAVTNEYGELTLSSQVSSMVALGKKLVLREYTRLDGDIEYLISENLNAVVTGVNAENTVSIPETAGGYNITAIANTAFEYTPDISDITLMSGVKEIASGAFLNLKDVVLHSACTEDNTYFKAFAEAEGIAFSETHSFGEATLVAAPTAECEGSIIHSCNDCGISETLKLPVIVLVPSISFTGTKAVIVFKAAADIFDNSGYGTVFASLDGLEAELYEDGQGYALSGEGDYSAEHTAMLYSEAAGQQFTFEITVSVNGMADIKKDSQIDILDFIALQKEVQKDGKADLDGDGVTTALDIVLFKKLLLFK